MVGTGTGPQSEVVLFSRERMNFIRPSTHTHLREDDPACAELLRYGEWYRERTLLLWLARETREGEPHITEYLGSVRAWEGELDRACMRRLVRRLVDVAPPIELRDLCRSLRRRLESFHHL